MKRVAVIAVAVVGFASGCSNAPIAGALDYCFPSKPSGLRAPERPIDPVGPDNRIPRDILPPVGPPGSGS